MIPAEAVEAAALAVYGDECANLWVDEDPRVKASYLQDAKRALEAAAPHMLVDLRSELVKLAQEFDGAEGGTLAYTIIVDRFGMRKNAHDQLMYIVANHLQAKS